MSVRILASPINPADINMIEGVYPTKPASLPAAGGNEGVAMVTHVGPDTEHLKVGDHVVPAAQGWGMWRTHGVAPESQWLRVPKDLPIPMAATLSVNPCTAFRLLQDFATLEPGDTVVQNGANSAVGQAVVQLARSMGLRTVNVVRDRHASASASAGAGAGSSSSGGGSDGSNGSSGPDPDPENSMAALRQHLESLGADIVLTEEEFAQATRAGSNVLDGFGNIRLGFNCVGGRSATNLVRALCKGGTLVTYGGMSKKPVTVPTGALIFNDISFRGFWLSRWNREAARSDREAMMDAIAQKMIQGEFKMMPHNKWSFGMRGGLRGGDGREEEGNAENEAKEALQAAMAPFSGKKQIFIMT